MVRVRVSFAAMLLLLMAGVLSAQPVVNTVADFVTKAESLRQVIIMPIDPCPGALPCDLVEQQIATDFRAMWHPRTIQASVVRQAIFDLGLSSPLDVAGRAKLAERLSADGFLIPTVPHYQLRHENAVAVFPEGDAPEARVELALFTLGAEGPLFRGTMQRTGSTISSPYSFVGGLFKDILRAVFPKRKRR